ncbi:MAG: MarR family winged helix-turn-helix transcriptional regulator [Phycisphaerales bacterium]
MPERTLQHEIGKKRPFESAAEEAYLNIVRTATALQGEIASIIKGRGLTGSSYNALRILRGHHPAGCPCGVISDHMVVRVPDVTRLLDRLEKSGLVVRERDSVDRRVVIAKVTRKGLDLIAKLDGPLLDAHERQLAHMTPAELASLNTLLVKARRPTDHPA